jgi:hypothetical protein
MTGHMRARYLPKERPRGWAARTIAFVNLTGSIRYWFGDIRCPPVPWIELGGIAAPKLQVPLRKVVERKPVRAVKIPRLERS